MTTTRGDVTTTMRGRRRGDDDTAGAAADAMHVGVLVGGSGGF